MDWIIIGIIVFAFIVAILSGWRLNPYSNSYKQTDKRVYNLGDYRYKNGWVYKRVRR